MVNPYAEQDPSQPLTVDWNARFSATERTYIYRVLYFAGKEEEWAVPFECDRSWRIRWDRPIDVPSMQLAASYLQGTHDFSTFRGAKCQRQSPIVTMKTIKIHAQPYGPALVWGGDDGGLLGMGSGDDSSSSPMLVTIQIVGDAFLYRQVRNMVGCLVQVGQGKLQATQVQDLLESKRRSEAPTMAPAHGLFLVDVQHGEFQI
jgi:tRNA pseudouridine38-40 synthase